MKRAFLLTALAVTMLAGSSPAFALTAAQSAAKYAADLLAGYNCSAVISCTKNANGTVTVKLPDGTLVTLVSPETSAHGGNHGDPYGVCGKPFQENLNGSMKKDGTPANCTTIDALRQAGMSGGAAVYKKTTVPGGNRNDPVCNASKDAFGFNPAGGLNGFTVTSSSSQSPGAC